MNDIQWVWSFLLAGRQVLLFLAHRNVIPNYLSIRFEHLNTNSVRNFNALSYWTATNHIKWWNRREWIPVKWMLQAHSFSSFIQLSSASYFRFPYFIQSFISTLGSSFLFVLFFVIVAAGVYSDLVCFYCARAFLNLQHLFCFDPIRCWFLFLIYDLCYYQIKSISVSTHPNSD